MIRESQNFNAEAFALAFPDVEFELAFPKDDEEHVGIEYNNLPSTEDLMWLISRRQTKACYLTVPPPRTTLPLIFQFGTVGMGVPRLSGFATTQASLGNTFSAVRTLHIHFLLRCSVETLEALAKIFPNLGHISWHSIDICETEDCEDCNGLEAISTTEDVNRIFGDAANPW